VYLQSGILRDVFIAVTGFTQTLPNVYTVSLHIKVLPVVSFVWGGSFFMVAAMLPMVGIEFSGLRKAMKGKEQDLYGDEEVAYISEESQEPTQ